MIAIIAPVGIESEYLESWLVDPETLHLRSGQVRIGKIEGKEVIIANSGIGKVNAAHTTTLLTETFNVSRVLLTGIGGAYPDPVINKGDVAIATSEVYGDEGVIGRVWHDLREIGIPLLTHRRRRIFNEIPVDTTITGALKKIEGTTHIVMGRFVTVSSCSGTEEIALKRKRRFRAICENMEGAAVAHICMLYNLPFTEIRGISNYAGIRDRRRWDIERASLNAQEIVRELLRLL